MDLDVRDEQGYSASYWAHRFKHAKILEFLPPPLKISQKEYYEHMMEVYKQHPDIMKGGKKKKKKGKGGKKKK